MTNEQIANELRGVPDAALQQEATSPSVPGYLVASEIQRRIQARNAPQQQGTQQKQPTLLAQMAKNLTPPQQPMVNNQPAQPLSPVPAEQLHQNPTPAMHFDGGGSVPRERYDGEDDSYVPPDFGPDRLQSSPIDAYSRFAADNPTVSASMPSAPPAVRRALQTAIASAPAPPMPPPKKFDPSKLPAPAAKPDLIDPGPAPSIDAGAQAAPTRTAPAADADAPAGASDPDANGVTTLPSGLKQRPPGVDQSAAWSEKSPLAGVNMPGAYGPAASAATGQTPVTAVPQTSTSPLQNPPNTHQGGNKFFQVMRQLAPIFSYVGNVGAGASMPGGNLGTGVGYANQQQALAQKEKAAEDFQKQELALKGQQFGLDKQKFGLEQQDALMNAIKSGAEIVPANAPTAPVMSPPPAMIGGVPQGAPSAPIPGSGRTLMPYGDKTLDVTGAMPQAVEGRAAALDIAKYDAQYKAEEEAKQATLDAQDKRREDALNALDPTHTKFTPEARLNYKTHGEFLKPMEIGANGLYDPNTGLTVKSGQPAIKPNFKEQAAMNGLAASLGKRPDQLTDPEIQQAVTVGIEDPQAREDRHATALNTQLLAQLAIKAKEDSAATPAAAQFAVDMLDKDPSFIGTLIKTQKGLVPAVERLYAQTHGGAPLPPVLSTAEQTNQQNAINTMNHIAKLKTLLADPDSKLFTGPLLGNIGQLEEHFGAVLPRGLTPAQSAKAQDMRASLLYLFLREGKSLMSGRPPEKLMEELKAVSASPGQQAPMLLGSLNAARRSAVTSLQTIYQSHGQAPPAAILPPEVAAKVGGGAPNPAAAAAVPGQHFRMTGADGKPKEYIYKGGPMNSMSSFTEVTNARP